MQEQTIRIYQSRIDHLNFKGDSFLITRSFSTLMKNMQVGEGILWTIMLVFVMNIIVVFASISYNTIVQTIVYLSANQL